MSPKPPKGPPPPLPKAPDYIPGPDEAREAAKVAAGVSVAQRIRSWAARDSQTLLTVTDQRAGLNQELERVRALAEESEQLLLQAPPPPPPPPLPPSGPTSSSSQHQQQHQQQPQQQPQQLQQHLQPPPPPAGAGHRSSVHLPTAEAGDRCPLCDKIVYTVERVNRAGYVWHKSCFQCGALR